MVDDSPNNWTYSDWTWIDVDNSTITFTDFTVTVDDTQAVQSRCFHCPLRRKYGCLASKCVLTYPKVYEDA